MKRVLVMMLCLVFIASLIGCSNKESGDDKITSGETASEETNEEEGSGETEEATEMEAVDVTAEAENPDSAISDTAEVEEEVIVTEESAEEVMAEEVSKYKDGTYEYQTEPDYEGYYTKGTLVIEGGLITSVDWMIYDTRNFDADNNERKFDETYEELYVGNDYYVQQCRDDWSGSRGYAANLIEKQNIEEVDAVSAATWTNKKFKEFIRYALIEATNKE